MILEGSIRLSFNYAAGEVGSQFLTALRDRRVILGAVCPTCDRIACPPRSFCVECGDGVEDLVEVGPAGTVEAWTEVPGKGTFGLIRLDGAGTSLVHRLIGPGQWVSGARVIVRFADEGIANINDIEGFEIERGAS